MSPVHLPPNQAVLAFHAGLLAIALECNRPGLILPGCAGLLTVLLAIASLYREPFHIVPAAVLALCFATLLVHTRRHLHPAVGIAVILASVWAWRALLTTPGRILWPVAAACGLFSGALGWWLTGIAQRARQAKALPKAIN